MCSYTRRARTRFVDSTSRGENWCSSHVFARRKSTSIDLRNRPTSTFRAHCYSCRGESSGSLRIKRHYTKQRRLEEGKFYKHFFFFYQSTYTKDVVISVYMLSKLRGLVHILKILVFSLQGAVGTVQGSGFGSPCRNYTDALRRKKEDH